MNDFTVTGGARIGWLRASWPLVTLKVNKDLLVLNATILGSFVFTSRDIISIEPYKGFFSLGMAIKIIHRNPNYSSNIIFGSRYDAVDLINRIRATGFLNSANSVMTEEDKKIYELQKSGGFPIKTSVLIAIFVWWNIVLLSDIKNFPFFTSRKTPFGNGQRIAIAGIIVFSIAALLSKDFSKLILKEGRTIKDVDKLLYFLIILGAFMLIIGSLT